MHMPQVFKVRYQGCDLDISATYSNRGDELVLLIHGLGCTKDSFEQVVKYQELKKFSLLAYDLIGFGDSSKPQDFTYQLEEQAEIIHLLLEKLHPKKVHIVAHSMGGAIGLLLTEKIATKLVSFVNIEGNLIKEDCGLLSRKTISVSFKEFKNNLFEELITTMAGSKESGARLWAKWAAKSDPVAFYRSAGSLVKWSDSGNLIKKFKALRVPKIYVYGAKNSQMKILSYLDSISKIPISNSGHFVMTDNPREFCSMLTKFIMTK